MQHQHPFPMSTQSQLSEISRLLRNLIRTGVVSEVDTDGALCRVQTGELQTGWINWLARRAGRSRDWWAPSVGEQVLLLAVGGELDTAFVLTGIYCDEFPAPSASADGWRADLYPETPVTVKGFKAVIDQQAWTITKVTHTLGDGGYTTALELEVKLSDVEYEEEKQDE